MAGADGGTTERDLVAHVGTDPEFVRLVQRRDRLGLAVTAAIVSVYFGYILLLVFAPALMRRHVTPGVTMGFPLGLGVLLATFLLVAIHVGRSAWVLDPACARIVARNRT